MIQGTGLATWERIVDTWQHPSFARKKDSLFFACSDRHVDETNLSRTDKMYMSDLLGDRGRSLGISASTCMSNHALIVLELAD